MRSATGLWFMAGVVIAATSRLAAEYLFIIAFVPVLAWAGAGLVLLVVQLWRLMSLATRREALARGAIVLIGFGVFYPVAQLGGHLTERFRFARHRSEYDRVVAEVEAGKQLSSGQSDIQYQVDAGPPIRVAFPWPGGIVDNWCGIVHDPSREVMKSK